MTATPNEDRSRPFKGLPALLCAWTAMILLLAAAGAASAQEMALPVGIQWSLFDRILAFDRTFEQRSQGHFVVGVLHQSRNRASANAHDEFLAAVGKGPDLVLTAGRTRLVSIEATGPSELRRRLQEEGVHVLYVAPLRAVDLSQVAAVAADLGIVTFTGVREYMEDGFGIGLGIRGGRPEILVNLDVCRAVGMGLSSELLKLATVISSAGHAAADGVGRR
jgi:hypothetical protein